MLSSQGENQLTSVNLFFFNISTLKSLNLVLISGAKLNGHKGTWAGCLKLIRATAMLYKVRDYVNARISKPIYHGLFESNISYACIILGQNLCTINLLFILQKKALRLIHFKEHNSHTNPFIFISKIVKLLDKIKIENCLFIGKYVNNKLSPILNSWFIFFFTFHSYKTSFPKGHLKIPTLTAKYAKEAFIKKPFADVTQNRCS